MADSDYDSRDSRDDDRPRRRRDYDDRPAKKGGCSPWIIVLGVLGVLGVACAGGCVWFMTWSMGLVKNGQVAASGHITKMSSGDLTGAYNAMSAVYKGSHTQAQFEAAVKAAKLDQVTSVTWDDNNIATQQDTMTFVGTGNLKGGGTTPVTIKVRMLQDMKTYEIEDIGGSSFSPPPPTGTTPTTPATGK
jgi:hypothetical protein